MSQRPLEVTHPDYSVLAPLADAIFEAVGGREMFETQIPQLLRTAIDEVIDAPRTGRFTLVETEKTEKTYLGTKVEILFRNRLGCPKGQILDLLINGSEVDVKNTMGSNWSIPQEAMGHPCILVRTNEKKAKCDVGLILIKDEYLNTGQNRDRKRTISAEGRQSIWWFLEDHPYPPNFWEILPVADREEILNAGGGTLRLAALFERVQRMPISREQVQALAQQHDYMKRIRRNGGARDILAPKGIAILWGQGDRQIIEKLELGPVAPNEFISFTPETSEEIATLKEADHID